MSKENQERPQSELSVSCLILSVTGATFWVSSIGFFLNILVVAETVAAWRNTVSDSAAGWSSLKCNGLEACKIIQLLSVVFCVFRAVHKVDFRLIIKVTTNKWLRVEERSCYDRNSCFWKDLCFRLAVIASGRVLYPRRAGQLLFLEYGTLMLPFSLACTGRFSWLVGKKKTWFCGTSIHKTTFTKAYFWAVS